MSHQVEIEFTAKVTVSADDFPTGVDFRQARYVVENVFNGEAEEGSYDVDAVKVHSLRVTEEEE